MTISEYLHEQLIVFLDARDRNEALQSLVDALDHAGKITEKQTFYDAILEREKIVSTGVGLGVAIPHAKLEGYTTFFIAIGIQNKGAGIEWNALDGALVKIIFMIGGPENRQMDYLKILSALTTALRDPKRRKAILSSKTPKEILHLFENC